MDDRFSSSSPAEKVLGWRSVKSRVRGVKAGDAPEAACVGPKSGPIAPRGGEGGEGGAAEQPALLELVRCCCSRPPRLFLTALVGKLLRVEQAQICSALGVETGALVVIQK